MNKTPKNTFSKRFVRRYSLGRYSLYMVTGALLFWIIILGLGAYNSFRAGMENKQHVSVESATLMVAWIIFVSGFVSGLSSALRSKRGLHIGFLVPTDTEKNRIEKSHPVLTNKTWSFVFLSTLIFTLLGTGISLTMLEIFHTQNKTILVIASVFLPSSTAAFLSWLNTHHSVKSQLYSQYHDLSKSTSVFSYSLFQNALPYALFYTMVGIVIALWKFSSRQTNSDQVTAELLWKHLSATSFFISLFLTSAAKVKAKIDFLGPIEFQNSLKIKPLKFRWRLLYAFVIPPSVYLTGRFIFYVFSFDTVSIRTAVTIKGAFCIILGLSLCIWAVKTSLGQLITDGKNEHPYVRFRNFLQRSRIT